MDNVILITGCSTGIGKDLAQHLSKRGDLVVATARNPESLAGLDVALALPLDVTSDESVSNAVKNVIDIYGRIDVLVNNAGYAQVGAVEEVTLDQMKSMYEVNVFGVLRMIKTVLPAMRKRGQGKIINISSIAGKLVTPVNGGYSSTKFALEALSDALRMELGALNIDVVLVEPGPIKTRFDQTVHVWGDRILNNPTSPYTYLYKKHVQVSDEMRKTDSEPGVVSKVIAKAIDTDKPKPRYLAGTNPLLSLVIALRDWVWYPAVNQMYRTLIQE